MTIARQVVFGLPCFFACRSQGLSGGCKAAGSSALATPRGPRSAVIAKNGGCRKSGSPHNVTAVFPTPSTISPSFRLTPYRMDGCCHYTFYPSDTTRQVLCHYFHNFQCRLFCVETNANAGERHPSPEVHSSFSQLRKRSKPPARQPTSLPKTSFFPACQAEITLS